jgi:iron complex outermembrane receptor protein
VNDAGNWAARGQLRFQPPGTEMDWLLNAHGSRLDQQSTLGQAIGTQGGFFGGGTSAGYRDPDIVEMNLALIAKFAAENPDLPPGDPIITDLAADALATELARDLDIRPYRGDYSRVGQTQLDTWGVFLRGDWSIGPVDFTTISGYETYERSREQDQDFTPDQLFESVSSDEAWQLSQELKLGGELREHPFRWEIGGYYLMEQLESSQLSLLRQSFADISRVYEQDLWSFGVFAGFGWDFLDDFTLEGGVRYNWERKDFDFTLTQPNLLLFGVPLTSRVVTDATWQAPTGTLSLTYHFGEDVSVYWKYSRGWKGGHFNAVAQKIENLQPVEPETIDAFEVGLRGRWLDGRVGLGLSLFYYSYTDYQVFIVEDAVGAPPTYQIVNANDAEVYGGELDVRAEPIDGLVLSGRFGWLESQFLDFTNDLFRSVPDFDDQGRPIEKNLPVTVNYSGNRLINSPQFKASFAAEWTVDLGRWGALIPRYDFAWSDDIFFDPSEGLGSLNAKGETVLPEYAVGQRAFWLHNAQLAYRTPEGNIELTGWVLNFMDKTYKTFAFDASTFSDVVINFVGEPRTYGVSVSVAW